MRKLFLLTIIIFIIKFGSYAKAEESTLSQPFKWTIGDWVAYRLSEEYRVVYKKAMFNKEAAPDEMLFMGVGLVPISVYYDREKGKIFVEIPGTAKTAETGKKGIKFWLAYIATYHIPEMKGKYIIKLEKNDYILVYIHLETSEEIVRWENGQYLLPED